MEHPTDKLWENFWKDKDNRKLFHRVNDSQKSVQIMMSRSWFLTQCFKQKVCPATLRARTLPQHGFSQDTVQDWRNLQSQTQQGYIRLAQTDLKKELVIRQEALDRANIQLSDKLLDLDTRVRVADTLEKEKISALKQANNDHRMKLRNLLTSAGRAIPYRLQTRSRSILSVISGFNSNLSILDVNANSVI